MSVFACNENESSETATDAGGLSDVMKTSDDAASDSATDTAAPPVCKEGRRRCVGSDLQLCDDGGWVLLQSCLPGEWCDVAVGICRALGDAGPDSSRDAS
ncbi:hypothetical protein AKJ09_05716 [Labilithrix luteola]|uniref:Uncharacterized protein n=1 Tax=Labilithrix luteola TaxID=1391654 RepID=A0A0K1PZY1_9BACT|nr:hypothetical protein AKJ09_05716 [Labilithrix luteola]